MERGIDWFQYMNKIGKRSFFFSFIVHLILLFSLFLTPPKGKKIDFQQEIFIVKMVNIPSIEIPEIIEKKEGSKLKENLKKIEMEKGKKEFSVKSPYLNETFFPDEYKKKLLSKISDGLKVYQREIHSSVNIEVKSPEIKTTDVIQNYQSPTFEIPSWYIEILKKRIEENWNLKGFITDLSAIVSFRIYREGKVENIVIEKSSGYRQFDNSIIEAIKSVKKWPDFPKEIKDRYIDVIIEFKMEG